MNNDSIGFIQKLKNSFKYTSRVSRLRHIGLMGFWMYVPLFVFLIKNLSEFYIQNTTLNICISILSALCFLYVAVSIIILKIRRLHDFNCSGYWLFLAIIPFIGQLWTLAIFLIPGTKGANKYGSQILNYSYIDYLLFGFFILFLILAAFVFAYPQMHLAELLT